MTQVLLDAENVRRSNWPNVSAAELVERCGTWADRETVDVLLVFDGRSPEVEPPERVQLVGSGAESADDWIARRATQLAVEHSAYWLVTSDRELRARAGAAAERVIGGGSFLRDLD